MTYFPLHVCPPRCGPVSSNVPQLHTQYDIRCVPKELQSIYSITKATPNNRLIVSMRHLHGTGLSLLSLELNSFQLLPLPLYCVNHGVLLRGLHSTGVGVLFKKECGCQMNGHVRTLLRSSDGMWAHVRLFLVVIRDRLSIRPRSHLRFHSPSKAAPRSSF